VEGEEVGRGKVLVTVEDPKAEKAKGGALVELRSTFHIMLGVEGGGSVLCQLPASSQSKRKIIGWLLVGRLVGKRREHVEVVGGEWGRQRVMRL